MSKIIRKKLRIFEIMFFFVEAVPTFEIQIFGFGLATPVFWAFYKK